MERRDEYCGRVVILGCWKNDLKKNIKAIVETPNAVIVNHTELMDYAKKLHKTRREYEELEEELEEKKELLNLMKSFKSVFDFLRGDRVEQ